VRTDFFTRPPRLTATEVARIWKEQEGRDPPFIGLRDLERFAAENTDLARRLAAQRPLLERIGRGRESLETALDAERRELMHANERRLECYLDAGRRWAAEWPSIERDTAGLDLPQAHARLVERARALLPTAIATGSPSAGDPPNG